MQGFEVYTKALGKPKARLAPAASASSKETPPSLPALSTMTLETAAVSEKDDIKNKDGDKDDHKDEEEDYDIVSKEVANQHTHSVSLCVCMYILFFAVVCFI
jgi:hypothetical protein